MHDSIRLLSRALRSTIAPLVMTAIAPLMTTDPLPAQTPARSVTERPLAEVQRAADEIDALVGGLLRAHEVTANPIVDDATFLRRAYVSVVGRIPAVDEVNRFALDRRPDKRSRLIDELLDAPGYVSHELNFWADLLRARSRLMRQTSGEPFLHFLKDALVEGTPYDKLVEEMLTATGAAHARGNGATGYVMRDLGMPEDNMANTMRVFLGTRLECAQCHNHPFDKWTQKDFYQLTAFTGGMQYRTGFEQSEQGRALRELGAQLVAEHGRQAQQALRRLTLPAAVGISGTGTGFARLPDNYKYDDAKPKQPVVAKTPFGAPAALAAQPMPQQQRRPLPARPAAKDRPRNDGGKPIDSRTAFADWLTSPENPRFALVIANRLWKKVIGLGLIEPVDDIKDDTRAVAPELMDRLSRLVVELGFDTRQFERVLLHTQLFQRATPAADPSATEPYWFPGPLMRRFSAEEMWDSLLTLVVPDLDKTLRPAGARAEDVYQRYEKLTQPNPEEIKKQVEMDILRTTDPEKYRQMQREMRENDMRTRVADTAVKQREARPLLRDLAVARKNGDETTVARLMGELRKLGVPLPGEGRRGQAPEIARASDLPSPAPENHPLHLFGQSDRETVDAGHAEANVPQVLALLNGLVDSRILDNKESALRRAIDAQKSPEDKIKAAWLATLARQPEAHELALWRQEVGQRGEAAMRDLAWVLINSNEFRFVR